MAILPNRLLGYNNSAVAGMTDMYDKFLSTLGPATNTALGRAAEPSRVQMQTITPQQQTALQSSLAKLQQTSTMNKYTSALNDQYGPPTARERYPVAPTVQSTSTPTPLRNSPLASPANAGGGSPSKLGGGIIGAAKTMIGKPYVWGGTNPNKGMDCSGLTQYSARQAGMNIPRTASAQYSWFKKNNKLTTIENAKPGDLLYFHSGSSPSGWHTGVYIGNGQMIDAAGRKSGIKYSSIGGRDLVGVGRT